MSSTEAGHPAQTARPRVAPGGLVTVAYMKARLDEGKDQLGIFTPLVLDVLPNLPNRRFTVADVQQALLSIHGVSMPQQAITTLLRRASKNRYITREAGTYQLNPAKPLPRSNVAADKSNLGQSQIRLGEALKAHADSRETPVESPQAALDLILRFLQEQQVAVLLGSTVDESRGLTARESAVVAEFLHDVVTADVALTAILRNILEGLVLYHAAFLPDLSDTDRKFNHLTVVFDSGLVRQALGYEGATPRALVQETIDLLQASGVRCIVFDKTVQEIHRILRMYEQRLATQEGRRNLWAYPMSRHFITQRYSPSDVQEMSALLESEIPSCGLKIIQTPEHQPEFTHGEARLAERFTNPTQDPGAQRIVHDVDCVAGVLTLRANHRSARIEDARAIFVTTTQLVVTNTRIWWEVDEQESGVPPVVHVRSLANLAWLKKPGVSPELHMRDLVALCAAAMRPSPKTWQRFLQHLDNLRSQNRLSADQATAIIVSAVSDKMLRDAELDQDDGDVDAGTLDEVVGRVMATYEAQAQVKADTEVVRQQRLASQAQANADSRIKEADETLEQAQSQLRNIAEELRRRDLASDRRARRWSAFLTGACYWLLASLVVIGVVVLAVSDLLEHGWGILIAVAVLVFLALELIGVLGHLTRLREHLHTALHRQIRDWLLATNELPEQRRTPTIDGARL